MAYANGEHLDRDRALHGLGEEYGQARALTAEHGAHLGQARASQAVLGDQFGQARASHAVLQDRASSALQHGISMAYMDTVGLSKWLGVTI